MSLIKRLEKIHFFYNEFLLEDKYVIIDESVVKFIPNQTVKFFVKAYEANENREELKSYDMVHKVFLDTKDSTFWGKKITFFELPDSLKSFVKEEILGLTGS